MSCKAVFSFAREATPEDRQKAHIYAIYHTHDLYGDTRYNRMHDCVDEEKEQQLIKSIVANTDMWWSESLGICEDNVYFSGKEKVIKDNNTWYVTLPELELHTNINSGISRIFHTRKDMKRALGDKYYRLSREEQKKFIDFWKHNPTGIVIIGKI